MYVYTCMDTESHDCHMSLEEGEDGRGKEDVMCLRDASEELIS